MIIGDRIIGGRTSCRFGFWFHSSFHGVDRFVMGMRFGGFGVGGWLFFRCFLICSFLL